MRSDFKSARTKATTILLFKFLIFNFLYPTPRFALPLPLMGGELGKQLSAP